VALAGGWSKVYLAAFQGDGQTLAALSFDGQVNVYDTATGKVLREFAVANADTASYWADKLDDFDFSDRTNGLPQGALFSADGSVVAVAREDGYVHLWEIARGLKLACLAVRQERSRGAMYFAPDGKFLVTSDEEHPLQLWELPTGKLVASRKAEKNNRGYFCCAFAPDGKTLAWTTGSQGEILEVKSCKVTSKFALAEGNFEHVAFDGDAARLVTASSLERDHGFHVWDARSGHVLRHLSSQADARSHFYACRLATTAQGPAFPLAMTDGKGGWWSLFTLLPTRSICDIATWKGESVGISPDGRVAVVSSEGKLVFREMLTGAKLAETATDHRGFVASLTFSADGKFLASAGNDSSTVLWDWQACVGLNTSGQDLVAAWTALAGEDAAAAYRAIGSLTAAGPKAVALLAKRVQPVAAKDLAATRKLLADLNDTQYSVRQTATKALSQLGAEAEPLFHEVLVSGPSLEVRKRLEPVRASPTLNQFKAGTIRQLRAVYALERIGSKEARQLLASLANGEAAAWLTAEARAALKRQGWQP
jgi:WD40 repeat protein